MTTTDIVRRELWGAACHEAGHAVLYSEYGVSCDVSVFKNPDFRARHPLKERAVRGQCMAMLFQFQTGISRRVKLSRLRTDSAMVAGALSELIFCPHEGLGTADWFRWDAPDALAQALDWLDMFDGHLAFADGMSEADKASMSGLDDRTMRRATRRAMDVLLRRRVQHQKLVGVVQAEFMASPDGFARVKYPFWFG